MAEFLGTPARSPCHYPNQELILAIWANQNWRNAAVALTGAGARALANYIQTVCGNYGSTRLLVVFSPPR